MIGEQRSVRVQRLHRREELRESIGRVDVGRLVAELAVNLREDRSTEPIAAAAEIDQQQLGIARIANQERRQGATCVGDARKCRHDQRHRPDHLSLAAGDIIVAPRGAHRQRVLSDRNRDPERGAQLDCDALHRVEQRRIFARITGRGHPVGRELDVGELRDRCRCNVGQCFTDGHPSRRGRIEHRDGRSLAHRHRFAGVTLEVE